MRQMTLAQQAEFQRYSKKTRREQFLEEMNAVMPWAELLALIEPHYPKGEMGRKPVGLEIVLRVYFLQQWFALSDPGVEDALYESPVLRRFAGIDLGARRSVETTLARAGFSREDLSVVLELDSTEGLLSAVEAGLGVAIISRRAVHNRIRPGGVRIARVRGIRLSSSFLIDNRTGEIQTSPVAAFRSFLLSKIQTLIESKVYPFPRSPTDTTADVVPSHVRAAPRM